jgi:hypothetical protein
MFQKFDYRLQWFLLKMLIVFTCIDLLYSLFTWEFIMNCAILSALTIFVLGFYQLFSAAWYLIFVQEQQRIIYLVASLFYLKCSNIFTFFGFTTATTNLSFLSKEIELIFTFAIPISLAIWYYSLTYKAYKEVT